MIRKIVAALLAWSLLGFELQAQAPAQIVQRPHAPALIRPYEGATVPPVQLKNSGRIYTLIRAGKLYLTVQDALAVAIENNLDLELDRYGPIGAEWNLERLRAGGALPGVTAGNTLANLATSGQGIAGSQLAAGLSGGGGGGGGGGTNAVISQIGPVTQNLDPVLQSTMGFFHSTTPQANTVQSQITALVDTRHLFNNFVQQGLISGGYVQVAANESYLKENTPTDILNPSVAPVVQLFVTHQFLQGFGVAVNSRFIRVAEKGIGAARETFRSQLLNVVVNVLNLYWDLVTSNDDLKVKQRALEQAQKVVNDTQKQIDLGAVPRVDIYAVQAQLSARRQDLSIAEATVRQQENLLKSALSRNGLADPLDRRRRSRPARPHPGSRPRRSAAVARTGGPSTGASARCGAREDQRRKLADLGSRNRKRHIAGAARNRRDPKCRSVGHRAAVRGSGGFLLRRWAG